MSDAINYPDSQGPLAENYVADEELMSADILIGQEVVYKNLTAALTSLVGAQETGADYIAHGLQLIWNASMACTLKAGTALSTQGYYYNGTGTWAFVANSAGSGNTFSVINPADQSVSFSPYMSTSGIVLCTLQVAPALVQNALLSRNIYDPGTGGVTPQNVYTRYNFGLAVSVVASAPNASQAPAATAGYIKIAEVTIPANATTLAQSNIIDWQRSHSWTNQAGVTLWAGNTHTRAINISSSYTIPSLDYSTFVNASGGASGITITLPFSSTIPPDTFIIMKTDSTAGGVSVVTQGSDSFFGASPVVLSSQFESVSLTASAGGYLVRASSMEDDGYAVVQRTAAGDINVSAITATSVTASGVPLLSHGAITFSASGTFTVPPGITSVYLTGNAAGGDGDIYQAGGGGGEWCFKSAVSVTPGESIPVTIGAHGAVTSFGSFQLNPGGDASTSTPGSGGSGGSGSPGGKGGFPNSTISGIYPASPGLSAGGQTPLVASGYVASGGGGGSLGAGGNGEAATTSSSIIHAENGVLGGGGGGAGLLQSTPGSGGPAQLAVEW